MSPALSPLSVLQGGQGRWRRVWRRQELEEHLCWGKPHGLAPAGPSFAPPILRLPRFTFTPHPLPTAPIRVLLEVPPLDS